MVHTLGQGHMGPAQSNNGSQMPSSEDDCGPPAMANMALFVEAVNGHCWRSCVSTKSKNALKNGALEDQK